ncbi:hypothetical protein D3C87_1372330 [compost metagenome]
MCLEKDLPSQDSELTDLYTAIDKIDERKKLHWIKFKDETVCKQDEALAGALFPNVSREDYLNILDQSNRANFMKKLRDQTCKNRVDVSNIEAVTDRAFTKKGRLELFDQIDEQLNNKNIIEIGYDASILTSTDFETKSTKANHSSLVVGRRFNDKTMSCEYLIRNSWGKSCGSYRGDLDCEEGNIWIPKEDLIKDLSEITYIK